MTNSNKLTGLALTTMGLVLLASAAGKWASSPVTTKGNAVITSAAPSPAAQPPHSLTGVNFSTKVPAEIVVRTQNAASGGSVLEQIAARNRTGQVADQLAITVGSLDAQPLNELSAVRLRQNDAQNYNRIYLPRMPEGTIVYERKDNTFEKAAFWPGSRGRYAAVVVSGTADRGAYLTELLRSAASNWQWK